MKTVSNNNEVVQDNNRQIELFPFEKDGKWGFIKSDLQWAIQPVYDEIDSFNEGLAAVLKADKWGYINLSGDIALDFTFITAGPFTDGQAWVRTNAGFSIINKEGGILKSYSEEEIDEVLDYSSNMYLFQKDEKYGYFNNQGIVVNPIYDEASSFCEDIAIVTLNSKASFINVNGEEILSSKEYTPLDGFSEGVSQVLFGKNEYAYIDKTGKIVISPSKRIGSSFSEGRAFYFDSAKMKFGYMDHSGTEIIPPKYDAALPFIGGLAYVKNGIEVEVIDVDGKTKYNLPKNTVVDVDSYLLNLDLYLININGDEKIVNRNFGEIRNQI